MFITKRHNWTQYYPNRYCICLGIEDFNSNRGGSPLITSVLLKSEKWYYGNRPKLTKIFGFDGINMKDIAFFNTKEEALSQIYQLALVENL